MFWISGLFWFEYAFYYTPEMFVPQFFSDTLEPIWFMALVAGDPVLFGYLITIIVELFANRRVKLKQ